MKRVNRDDVVSILTNHGFEAQGGEDHSGLWRWVHKEIGSLSAEVLSTENGFFSMLTVEYIGVVMDGVTAKATLYKTLTPKHLTEALEAFMIVARIGCEYKRPRKSKVPA